MVLVFHMRLYLLAIFESVTTDETIVFRCGKGSFHFAYLGLLGSFSPFFEFQGLEFGLLFYCAIGV